MTNDKNIDEWKKSLELMTEVYTDGALNILKGETNTLESKHLNIEQKQELFKHFMDIIFENHNKNHQILNNGVEVFLKLFRENFFMKRKTDLTPDECYTLLVVLDNVTKYKMMQLNYSPSEVENFYNYKEQILRGAKLRGLYNYFDENPLVYGEKRKHFLNK
jgi:hypothetical protein